MVSCLQNLLPKLCILFLVGLLRVPAQLILLHMIIIIIQKSVVLLPVALVWFPPHILHGCHVGIVDGRK
jgi:hypothetical protein